MFNFFFTYTFQRRVICSGLMNSFAGHRRFPKKSIGLEHCKISCQKGKAISFITFSQFLKSVPFFTSTTKRCLSRFTSFTCNLSNSVIGNRNEKRYLRNSKSFYGFASDDLCLPSLFHQGSAGFLSQLSFCLFPTLDLL